MKAFRLLHPILIIGLLMVSFKAFPKQFIVYSIVQELPMGETGEKVKKNFYMNLGSNQGVRNGTVLDVFRTVSRLDPYETKQRYNYKVKIGELKVIHVENNSAIGKLNAMQDAEDDPLFEIPGIMIGDQVSVKISD